MTEDNDCWMLHIDSTIASYLE